jgi:hypothetical protein
MNIYPKKIAFLIILFIFFGFSSKAQSLIAGIPSADVVHKGHLEYTHESQVNFWTTPNQTKWASFNFLCYGIGNGIEISTSVINLSNKNMNNLAAG